MNTGRKAMNNIARPLSLSLALFLAVEPVKSFDLRDSGRSISSHGSPMAYGEAVKIALDLLTTKESIERVRRFGGNDWKNDTITYNLYELKGCSIAAQAVGLSYVHYKGKSIRTYQYSFMHVNVCKRSFDFDSFQ